MAKNASSAVLDATLNAIAAATEMYVCEGQPTTRAEAISLSAIPAITMASGDFTLSTQSGGRRLAVAAKSATANASRPVNHVALCSGSEMLVVTTCPSQNTNSGSTVSVAAFNIDNPQPA